MSSATTPPVHLVRIDSPIGRLEIASNGEAIVSLSIESDGRLPHESVPEQRDAVLDRAVAQLAEYFAGDRRDFDLPVDSGGTAFQRAVWEQLVELEWGEVVTYGELGRGAGHASAGRAVGGAIRANPVPIIVPCHRVVGSDGAITGYSAGEGVSTKRWLLAHEGAEPAARRRVSPGADGVLPLDPPTAGSREAAPATAEVGADASREPAA